jgi:hypothetical protein
MDHSIPTNVYRLDRDSLTALRRSVNPSTFVTGQTTDIQAGYMLGVQHVLNALQEGFTVETAPPQPYR